MPHNLAEHLLRAAVKLRGLDTLALRALLQSRCRVGDQVKPSRPDTPFELHHLDPEGHLPYLVSKAA